MNSLEMAVDIVQTMSLIGVMAMLAYACWLLKIELRAAANILHGIVRAQEEIAKRLDAIERERG